MKFDKIKDIFSLTQTQKRGFFLLCILMLVIVVAPALYKVFFFRPQTIDMEKERNEIEKFLSLVRYKSDNKKTKYTQKEQFIDIEHSELSAAESKLSPFFFNPNNLPAEKWLEMGFSERQVKTIKNYEYKGGRFLTKDDVRKMWSISKEEYDIIKPYILLPDSIPAGKTKKTHIHEEKIIQIVEINSADTSALKTLPGIGSIYALHIFNYKMKLGGFYSKSQLLEVAGMDTLRLKIIEPYIDINPWIIRKININTADFYRLSSHPYISKNAAISIINYRNRHGNYSIIEDIMKSEIIDEELFNKLAPYLTTE